MPSRSDQSFLRAHPRRIDPPKKRRRKKEPAWALWLLIGTAFAAGWFARGVFGIWFGF